MRKSLAVMLALAMAVAGDARAQLNGLDETGSMLRVPDGPRPTDADLATLKGNPPALARAHLQRGLIALQNGDYDASLAEEDAALAIDPELAHAHAVRALALVGKEDPRAEAAADRAIALDPRQDAAWTAKGFAASQAKRWADADVALGRAVAINAHNARSYAGRAAARIALRRPAEALDDLDAAVAIQPGLPIHALRMAAFQLLRRYDEALHEADSALALDPAASDTRQVRSLLRAIVGDPEGARADLDVLIAAEPKLLYYLRRTNLQSSIAKRGADLDAALRLDPGSSLALTMRLNYELDIGAVDRAAADLAAAEKLIPGAHELMEPRFRLLVIQGRRAEAMKMLDAYAADHAGDAAMLNERCWIKAIANVDVEAGLDDCEAALRLKPHDAMMLDSRAFAQLRLGRPDAAIADYDEALSLMPTMTGSLYGRGLAWLAKGDHVRGMTDIAAARRFSPAIDMLFAGYGMPAPDGERAATASR